MEKVFIPLATVRKVFRKRKKTDLTYEQKMALENAEEFTRLN
jgi:DNA-directed RNA polymerase subunit F